MELVKRPNKNISKKAKLFVKQNRGGTMRRVDRSNKMIGSYLIQHLGAWFTEVNELNKEALKAKTVLNERTLIIPQQAIPEGTYDMLVKELKPAMAGTKNNPSFILYVDTPISSHPICRFNRTKDVEVPAEPTMAEEASIKRKPVNSDEIRQANNAKEGKTGLTKAVDQIEAEKIEVRKARAKENRAKLKAKRLAEKDQD